MSSKKQLDKHQWLIFERSKSCRIKAVQTSRAASPAGNLNTGIAQKTQFQQSSSKIRIIRKTFPQNSCIKLIQIAQSKKFRQNFKSYRAVFKFVTQSPISVFENLSVIEGYLWNLLHGIPSNTADAVAHTRHYTPSN